MIGKEFNDKVLDGLFAATPPLEALRMLISWAATVDVSRRKSSTWSLRISVSSLQTFRERFSKLLRKETYAWSSQRKHLPKERRQPIPSASSSRVCTGRATHLPTGRRKSPNA